MVAQEGRDLPPIRSWLYVAPVDQRDLEAAVRSGADALILDLEDLTPAPQKARARALAANFIESQVSERKPLLFGRINPLSSGIAHDDLDAFVRPGIRGLRLPKVESGQEVAVVDRLVGDLERDRGLAPGSVRLVPIIESAAGVAECVAIARASPRVALLGFGSSDFLADVDGSDEGDGIVSLYARSRLVIASRCAGLAAPCDGVYLSVTDIDGLRRSTLSGRRLGFFGRTSVDARQIAEINALLTPTVEQVRRARELVEAVASAEAKGIGSFTLADGSVANVAVAKRARRTAELAEALGVATGRPGEPAIAP